jgi:hypothetical protein
MVLNNTCECMHTLCKIALSQFRAELFAMVWGLRPGGTVFAGLVSLAQADPACLPCAQGLVCASYI